MNRTDKIRDEAARERASRARRRRKISARLLELERRHEVMLFWFSDFHVRVTVKGEAWDLWPSTTAWRRVGTGTGSSFGWKKFLEAVGIKPTTEDSTDA